MTQPSSPPPPGQYPSPGPYPTPAPHPPTMAYAPLAPQVVDAGHLSALAICHFVWGGLVALFSCFGLVYVGLGVAMMRGAFAPPAAPTPAAFATTQQALATAGAVATSAANAARVADEQQLVGVIFLAMGGAVLLLGWALAACTIASGVCIRRRRRRVFSVVVAAINCAFFPFGTTLGVFTLMVLLRESVRRTYEERAAPVATLGA